MIENCPVNKQGYEWIDRNCYFFESANMTYSAATANCNFKFNGAGRLFEPKTARTSTLVYHSAAAAVGRTNAHMS